MKITVQDDVVKVISPYDTTFITGAKQINGVWEKPCWIFPAENEELVRDLLKKVYGTDGTPEPSETLLITLGSISMGNRLMIGSIEALSKSGRDTAPRLGDGCTIIQGKLLARGGSRANPRITHTNDCVLRLKDVPRSVARKLVDKFPDAYAIFVSEDSQAIEWTPDEEEAIKFLRKLSSVRLATLLKELSYE